MKETRLARDEQIADLYLEGWRISDIAAEVGMSQGTVIAVAKARGLSRSTRRQRACETCRGPVEESQGIDCRACVDEMIALWRREVAA